MSDNLIFTHDLTAIQIASLCDLSFLATYSSFQGQEEDPRRLREQYFHAYLDAALKSERTPYSLVGLSDLIPAMVEYLDQQGRNEIKVTAAICFPYGSVETDFKVSETRITTAFGAAEIDVVFNYKRFKAGDIDYARDDVKAVMEAAHENGALAKLIIETYYLSPDEIKGVCHLAEETDVDFIKTCALGWASGPCLTMEDLMIVREHFSRGIKISGAGFGPENIRDFLQVASGRTDDTIELNPQKLRIGTSVNPPSNMGSLISIL
jgi:deoxyribose-phosphate aldolase